MDRITTAAPNNRRSSQRRKPRRSVQVECRKGAYGLGANVAGTTLDISETGVRIVVQNALAVMSEVEIVVGGYGMTKPLKRIAYIRWQVKLEDGTFCIGVEFQKRLNFRDLQSLASPR